MANPKHVVTLSEGVQIWNEWRDANEMVVPDLSGADLQMVDLTDANLARANLKDAELNGAEPAIAKAQTVIKPGKPAGEHPAWPSQGDILTWHKGDILTWRRQPTQSA